MVVALRMIERLLAVGIGGMSIYLGYRLFLALPNVHDASGELRLPIDIRVVLGRVGPGAFFALFGAAVVALSLYAAVRYDATGAAANSRESAGARGGTYSFAGLANPRVSDDASAVQRADARALLRRDMAELNSLSGKLRNDLPEQDRADVAGLLRRVKLKLLLPVWEGNWGDPATFEEWVTSGPPNPPAALADPAALYFYGTTRGKP